MNKYNYKINVIKCCYNYLFSLEDQDNELVTFSTGEELVEALGSIEGDVFRIYVKVIGESPSHESLEGMKM